MAELVLGIIACAGTLGMAIYTACGSLFLAGQPAYSNGFAVFMIIGFIVGSAASLAFPYVIVSVVGIFIEHARKKSDQKTWENEWKRFFILAFSAVIPVLIALVCIPIFPYLFFAAPQIPMGVYSIILLGSIIAYSVVLKKDCTILQTRGGRRRK